MANGDSETEGRLCVLEEAKKQHGQEICKLWNEVSDIKSCVHAIPAMEKTLEKIDGKVDDLNRCKIIQEKADKGTQPGFWDSKWGDRLWGLLMTAIAVFATITGALYLQIFKVS